MNGPTSFNQLPFRPLVTNFIHFEAVIFYSEFSANLIRRIIWFSRITICLKPVQTSSLVVRTSRIYYQNHFLSWNSIQDLRSDYCISNWTGSMVQINRLTSTVYNWIYSKKNKSFQAYSPPIEISSNFVHFSNSIMYFRNSLFFCELRWNTFAQGVLHQCFFPPIGSYSIYLAGRVNRLGIQQVPL